MKGKRLMLVITLFLLLVVGWYMSVRAASGIDNRNAQQELVEQADIYIGKELYIRALPLYQQALDYSTERNAEIESKMLEIYTAQGDTDSYAELVEKRASEGSATEEEYLRTAQIYLEESSLADAMELLKKGMVECPAGAIEEMYEANRYGYTMNVTESVEIIPTGSNGYMPAFNGEKWGYVNGRGKYVLPAVYDSVVPFNNNGYAVVSLDNTYYTIISTGEKFGVDETHITDVRAMYGNYIIAQCNGKYGYYNRDFICIAPELQFDEMTVGSNGVTAVRNGEKWALLSSEGEMVTDYIYDDVAVNSLKQVFANGRAMVKQENLWYLIDTEGNKLCETGFADAKAPESAGYIAVANAAGKWGFIDELGEQVIDCQYKDAYSFSNHLAAVRVVDTWGYISEKNDMVIKEPLEEAKPFHNYIAQGKYLGQAALITLQYKEN